MFTEHVLLTEHHVGHYGRGKVCLQESVGLNFNTRQNVLNALIIGGNLESFSREDGV